MLNTEDLNPRRFRTAKHEVTFSQEPMWGQLQAYDSGKEKKGSKQAP